MPNASSETTVTGEIMDIFAHRFVVATARGRILADIGPDGAKQVKPKVGDQVELTGEQKPSELKVATFKVAGRTIQIERRPKPDHDDTPADPEAARAALRTAGFDEIGQPRRKPKHFEIRATHYGKPVEVHVGLDGEIRRIKPADAADSQNASRPA